MKGGERTRERDYVSERKKGKIKVVMRERGGETQERKREGGEREKGGGQRAA